MEVIDKIHYIVGEYNRKYKPIIQELLTGFELVEALTQDPDIDTEGMSESDRLAMTAELAGGRSAAVGVLKDKLLGLAIRVLSEAQLLAVDQSDPVIKMGDNLALNTTLSELSAKTESLKTAIMGMNAIQPGGAAGAAVVVAKNAPTIIQLGDKLLEKATQTEEATQEMQTLATIVTEIQDLTSMVERLK